MANKHLIADDFTLWLGKFILQSQHDDTEINAAKNIKWTATDGKIVGMAKEIHLIAEDGSFIKIGGGVTLGSKGDIRHQAANFRFSGPATMHTDLPRFAGVGKDPANWIALDYREPETAQGIAGADYEILFDGGPTVTGTLNENGKARHDNVLNKPVKEVLYKPRPAKKEDDAAPLEEIVNS